MVLPISTWSYRGEDDSIRHIGPISQDFYAAFGFGEDERYISMVDADGIAFSAIQGMFEIIQEQAAQIENQDIRMDDIEYRLTKIEQINSCQKQSQPETVQWLGWGLLFGFGFYKIMVNAWPYITGLSRRNP